MITQAELYLYTSRDLVGKEIQALLTAERDAHGGTRALARAVGWPVAKVKKLLDCRLLQSFPGPKVLELRFEDIRGKRYVEVRTGIERALTLTLVKLEPTWSNHDVADFLGVHEKTVRRFRERVGTDHQPSDRNES